MQKEIIIYKCIRFIHLPLHGFRNRFAESENLQKGAWQTRHAYIHVIFSLCHYMAQKYDSDYVLQLYGLVCRLKP